MVSYRVHINDVGHISYARAANRTAIGADRNIVIAAPRNNLRHGEHEAGHICLVERFKLFLDILTERFFLLAWDYTGGKFFIQHSPCDLMEFFLVRFTRTAGNGILGRLVKCKVFHTVCHTVGVLNGFHIRPTRYGVLLFISRYQFVIGLPSKIHVFFAFVILILIVHQYRTAFGFIRRRAMGIRSCNERFSQALCKLEQIAVILDLLWDIVMLNLKVVIGFGKPQILFMAMRESPQRRSNTGADFDNVWADSQKLIKGDAGIVVRMIGSGCKLNQLIQFQYAVIVFSKKHGVIVIPDLFLQGFSQINFNAVNELDSFLLAI